MPEHDTEAMTFWEHLDELRQVLFRMVLAVVALACVAFACKGPLFDLVLAPSRPDFVLYRWLNTLAASWDMPSLAVEAFRVEMINTGLASQFTIHMSVACYAGVLLASPYLIYLLFGFISPALHRAERRTCLKILFPACFLFLCGILLNYYVIFPLSFRFLSTYQVSESIPNMITLSSYVSSFTTLSLLLGMAFEIPVVAYLLGRLHLIHAGMLKRFRKHALVGILIVAAVITPTSDVFTLLLVSLPLYLLYELSIRVVKSNP